VSSHSGRASGENPLRLEVDGLAYELDRAPMRNGKKVVVSVRLASAGDGPPLVDRADLYSFRQRHALAALVAETFARSVDVVMGHLALLLDQVERATESLRAAKPASVVLTDARRRAAEKLLDRDDVLDRAADALAAFGYVGEEANKRLVYLVATSRLIEKPLSAILRAESGSGKSDLLEKLAALLPEESVEFLSRITPHALYYAGADHLRHKVVVVDEAAGTTEADYAIRTLQTKGLLRLAVTVKGRAESFEARGPIALLSGTTLPELNPENLSRCLTLPLDESPEQTARVQEAQRRAWAGRDSARALDLDAWRDAQRILEPLEVVIPFAERLAFPARTTGDRRDNMKLLTLVAAHTLLHQRRRDRDKQGRVVAEARDYAAIYALVRPVVEASFDGLSPRATALYRALVQEKLGATPFTRREASAALGWPYMTVKRALAELATHELVKIGGPDRPLRYALLDRTLLGSGAVLTPPNALR
jgi:hypothetical protein